MPNWSEGVLKIRGKKQDIENFIRNGIDYQDYRYEPAVDEKGKVSLKQSANARDCPIEVDEWEITVKNTVDLHIKGTHRMFITSKNIECWWHEKEIEIVYLDIQQAWAVSAEQLQDLSKKYNLDFKIFATEMGMEFCQDIEVVGGQIIKDNEIKFDDFMWEAPDPRLGG